MSKKTLLFEKFENLPLIVMFRTGLIIFVLGFLPVESAWPFDYLTESNGSGKDLLRGRLIAAAYNVVYSLDLKSGERTVLSRPEPSVGSIRVLGEFSETKILVQYSSFKNIVATYDLLSGKLTTLVEGREAMYSPTYGKLVYHRFGDGKTALVIVDINERDAPAEVIAEDVHGPAPRLWATLTPVLISDTEFLFQWEGRDIWQYSFETGKSRLLTGLKRCSLGGARWITGRGQLLCSDRKLQSIRQFAYLLTDLQGNISREIDFRRARPVAYKAGVDGILVQGERVYRKFVLLIARDYPLEFYDFSSGSLTEIFSDPMISGRTVWMN